MAEIKQGGKEKDSNQTKPRLGDIIETKEQLTNGLKDKITKNMASSFRIDWEIVKILIDAGADIEAKNFFNRTALMVAAAEGEIKVCEFLLERGAKIEAIDSRFGDTPLIQAAQCGKNNVCRLLIGKGADVNASNNGGWTALMYAANFNDLVTCQVLLENGAELRVRNVARNNAMDIAKSNKSMDAFYFLEEWDIRKIIGTGAAKDFISNFRECVKGE